MTAGSDRAFLDGVDRGEAPPVVFQGDGSDLVVVDSVEQRRYTLETPGAVDPSPASADGMPFPVDAAARVTADAVGFPTAPAIYVRDADRELVGEVTPSTDVSVGPGDHYLEVAAPMKLYLRVAGPFTVSGSVDGHRLDLDAPRPVVVGGRSRHERPAATVTTTRDPEDVMAAVSTFGSALKTTSPERTFPTLRGHPPLVELGDALAVPDAAAPPDTGVTIEVPPERRYVYPVAPLAHFLGARVVPGDHPRVTTEAGFVHDLAMDDGFQRAVERVLARTFLLDCVVRTEGLYDVDLDERRQVEPALDVDVAALYDRPLAQRLETYCSVPWEALAPAVPDWKLAAHVEPDPSTVEVLPGLVDDLAMVRTVDGARAAAPTPDAGAQSAAVDDLLRGAAESASVPLVREPGSEGADAVEVAWVGDGVPRGANKATAAAFRNRLETEPTTDGLSAAVVCNDPEMAREQDVVEDVYGGADLPLAVDCRLRLPTDELREVLAADHDLVHYVGHVDADGFRCPDGTLEARSLDAVGVDAFLLNACSSYHQGTALVDAGAVGGVVTLADVVDGSAARMGSTLARLLAEGYPLGPALEVARHASYAADDYVLVGDGTLQVAATDTMNLDVFRVRRADDGYAIEFATYTQPGGGMGTMTSPHVGDTDRYYLGPGALDEFHLDRDALLDLLGRVNAPVLLEGALHWSTDVDRSDLPAGR